MKYLGINLTKEEACTLQNIIKEMKERNLM